MVTQMARKGYKKKGKKGAGKTQGLATVGK